MSDTNPGPNSTLCAHCAAWRYVWRMAPLTDRASDNQYARVCGVCGKAEK